MIGPVINSAGIVSGALLGSLFGQKLSPTFRTKINQVFGCIALGIGVTLCAKVHSLPPMVVALIIGALFGESCHIETHVMRAATGAVKFFNRKKPGKSRLPADSFNDQFAVITVLFCASSLGVLGPMHEGISGDFALLCIKALLDFFTAMIFAANIGGIVGILAVPQFTLQLPIFLLASAITPLTTPEMFADFSACGGVIMLGTGLRQLGLLQVPILSMLPGLLLVMPISALWTRFF